ncbi:MAG: EscU/YscU/HrcU family type III secretion system export apparatus switch protein [Leptospirales bacterium]|nr:EscU/YscU/HrcU family type III secretion system export apparatus switch protein [Leptospirales bacterium]
MLAPDQRSREKQVGYRLAQALRFDRTRDRGPRVVARGRGADADRILAAARAAGVPVVEDAGLSEALRATPPGKEAPETLYRALAAVFSLIYRLDEERRRQKD